MFSNKLIGSIVIIYFLLIFSKYLGLFGWFGQKEPFTDKEKDIAEINRHLDAMEIVLSYNMVYTVFEEWKNEVSR